MSENDNKRGPLNPKSPQKGYQGWIIAALIATILGITYLNRTSTIRETTQKRFEKMMADKEVERVTIVNDNRWQLRSNQRRLNLINTGSLPRKTTILAVRVHLTTSSR